MTTAIVILLAVIVLQLQRIDDHLGSIRTATEYLEHQRQRAS